MTPWGRIVTDESWTLDVAGRAMVERLIALAPTGLASGFVPEAGAFAQTLRATGGPQGVRLQKEGISQRYTAMAALGVARLPLDQQRSVLGGRTAGDIVAALTERALHAADPGVVALAAWAHAEVNGIYADKLFSRLRTVLSSAEPLPTVAGAWLVTAAAAAHRWGDTDDLLSTGVELIRSHAGHHDIYPHELRAGDGRRWRGHVGSFADQVYPLQALARASQVTGDAEHLAAADRTAAQICRLQGEHGQWWWHYDTRDGTVVERFPVYSVHQHAMAPMVLLDLKAAGGADHGQSVARGLTWLESHPETVEELISDRWQLVWRKVGRREPRKAARALSALTTSVRPGTHLPGLDRLLPPAVVDHECRPYELGWMLYAWVPRGANHE